MFERLSADVTVIGGGPGGYIAAIRASQLGAKVVLVERDKLGGTCTNKGCMPTKALMNITELLSSSKKLAKYDVEIGYSQLNYAKILQDANTVAKELRGGVEFLLKKNNVNVQHGHGRLLDHKTVEVKGINGDNQIIETSSIIIATGSSPLIPQIPGVDSKRVMTNENILEQNEKPSNLVIMGGGTEGVEWSVIFNRVGTKVLLIEAADQILPSEDEQLAKILRNTFEMEGVHIKTGTNVTKIDSRGNELFLTLDNGESVSCDQVLVAVGRVPNSSGFGVDDLVATNKGKIVVDDHMRTKTSNIFAIGDVVGRWMLAHVAMHEGIVAAENAMGGDSLMNYSGVPRCVYTDPEAAFIGLSEKEAIEQRGGMVKTAYYPIRANGRARTLSKSRGGIKLVYEEKYGEILGAQIVSPIASELIWGLGVAMQVQATIDDLGNTIHAHPTLSEIIREDALRGLGREFHI